MTEFGAEHRNLNSFYFALAATCILICLCYSKREGLVTNRIGDVDGLGCLQSYLNYPWTGKVCTVLCGKEVCRQLFSLSWLFWDQKEKMSE